MCKEHGAQAAATLQENKKRFLDALKEGTVAVREAARRAGVDPATIWRWRQQDSEFHAAVDEATEDADRVRVSMVEDSLFARVVGGRASAAETIFFLVNRAPDRWRQRNEMDITHRRPWEEELRRLAAEAAEEAGEAPGRLASGE